MPEHDPLGLNRVSDSGVSTLSAVSPLHLPSRFAEHRPELCPRFQAHRLETRTGTDARPETLQALGIIRDTASSVGIPGDTARISRIYR